jgi:RimJ/RimL family protein N-acetyltransferase
MTCGTEIDLTRLRSSGVLTPEEVSFCRDESIPLAYDPIQIGWVPSQVSDDFLADVRPARTMSRGHSHSYVAQKPHIKALHPQYNLRAWELYDLADYKALLDDPLVWRYMTEPYPDPLTDETAAALIELSNASNHHQVFAILRDSKIVGQVRLLYDVDDFDPGVAEISYWLGRAFWGKGIGTDIVSLFSKRCFADNPGITTLIARVHRDNASSAKILSKAGYENRGSDPKDGDWMILSKRR